MGPNLPHLLYHPEGYEADGQRHRDQRPVVSVREVSPSLSLELHAQDLEARPGDVQDHSEILQDHSGVLQHHPETRHNCPEGPQYNPEGPEGYEVDRQHLSVSGLWSSSNRRGTDDIPYVQNNWPEQERYKKSLDHGANITTQPSIQQRIRKAFAAMTKNFYTSSDSGDGSQTESEPSDTSPEPSSNSSLSSAQNEVNNRVPDRSARQVVIQEGNRQRTLHTDSGYDSGIAWEVRGDETDGAKAEAWLSSTPSKETRNFEEKEKKESWTLENEDMNLLLAQGSLSNLGGGLLSKPLLVSGPVQVNFPKTAAAEGHTELYNSRSEAMKAIHRQNSGQFESTCTFDPAIRVIFVHALGSFIPNYDEIDKLGLELLSLPTCFDVPFYSRPTFSPYFNDENIHGGRTRTDIASLRTSMLPTSHSAFITGELAEHFCKPLTQHNASIYPSENVQRQPPNSPTSTMTGDHDEWQEDGSVFDDDFFLEYDPIGSRSYIGSHKSCSTSDFGEADDAQKDEPSQKESTFRTSYGATFENYTHARVTTKSPVSWRECKPKSSSPDVRTIKHFTSDGHLKTWPELWREYITMTSSSSHLANADQDNTGGVLQHEGSFSQVSVEVESPNQTGTANGGYRNPPNLILGEDLQIKLKEAENLSLQQAIDDIVLWRGDTLDRGTALISSPDPTIPILFKEDENINTGATTHQQETRVPHIKDLIEKFETSRTNSESEKQHMRVFSYPLEYSPLQSSPSSEAENQYASHRQIRRRQNQRNVSETSIQSYASGFKFTTYLNELAEIASNGSTCVSRLAKDDHMEGSRRVLDNVEPCRLPVDEDGLQRVITAEDLNIRIVGKAAQESKFAKQNLKGGALVELFQSHGLMPKANPTLHSPTTLGTLPFNNRTNQISSTNSSPAAPSIKQNPESEVARAAAFKEAFSRLSDRSSSDADSATSGLEESLNKSLPEEEHNFWVV